jgi:hypothetical protein
MELAKLRDDDLFKMPDGTHLGECPALLFAAFVT